MPRFAAFSFICAAVCMTAFPATAQIDLTISGYTKNYLGWMSQDDSAAATEENNFDMLRRSNLKFTAEGTADNGLVYGFYTELFVDGGDDANTIDESYLYLKSNMGKIIAGSENGAAYLLQVGAPGADPATLDGKKQHIQPVNYAITTTPAIGTTLFGGGVDYDNDITGKSEKITYFSPNWNGLQFGLSYTFEVGDPQSASGLVGFTTDDQEDDLGEAYEAAVRWEVPVNNMKLKLGAGYAHIEREAETTVPAVFDDSTEWNVAVDADIGAFGIGVVYTEQDNGQEVLDKDETIVVGVDYTTGPYTFGASWFNNDTNLLGVASEVETNRYMAGVTYKVADGLNFHASAMQIEHEVENAADVEATAVLTGFVLSF